MTFLNASLIIGTLAALVPVALHLIAKREPKKVTFPSIRFLTKRFESHRSRMRLRRWWLLAMRIFAVVSLAIALARPTIDRSLSLTWLTIGLAISAAMVLLVLATLAKLNSNPLSENSVRRTSFSLFVAASVLLIGAAAWAGWTYATGKRPTLDAVEPVAIAIVIDNGPTLGWQSNSDHRTRRAIDAASSIISTLPRTSRISVVDRSANPPVFSLDVSGALSKVDKIQPIALARPLSARIRAAVGLLRTSDLPNHQLVIITDLVKPTWKPPQSNAGTTDSSLAEPLVDDTDLGVSVFDLGPFEGVNRSLTLPKLADGTPAKNVPVSISTVLSTQSFGNGTEGGKQNEMETITAELQLYKNSPSLPVIRDGEVVYPQQRGVDRTSATVSGNGSVELVLNVPGLPIGNYAGRIKITDADSLSCDNQRFFTINVLPPSSVLLVSDRFEEAAVIESTLTVAATEIAIEDNEFQVERIGFNDLSVAVLDGFDVIVMLDPPAESFAESALTDYCRGGGRVLACLGPNFGQPEPAITTDSILPRVLRPWRVPDRGTFLQVMREQHAAVETLADDTPWDQFPVSQYWQVELAETDSVIVRYAGTGHPALVERQVSRGGDPDADADSKPGKFMLLTTPLPALDRQTRSWNRLFGADPWPAWLLTRQLIEYLTGRQANSSMTTIGNPLTLSLPGGPVQRPSRLQWFPPNGRPPVPMDLAQSADEITFRGIEAPGVHWIRGLPESLGFIANDQGPIDLTRIKKEELDEILGADRYQWITSSEEIRLAENGTASRVSLASPAMLLAFFIFLIEQVLANRFYQRPSGT